MLNHPLLLYDNTFKPLRIDIANYLLISWRRIVLSKILNFFLGLNCPDWS
jgi:hypothetical protein